MADAKQESALEGLLAHVRSREGLSAEPPDEGLVAAPFEPGDAVYGNRNERLGIDFTVERMAFPELQVIDPRVVRIPPGANNERHKHAHESLFVVLEGKGEVAVGDRRHPVEAGQVAFVPRWYFHQTFNTSATEELVVLAITDFGLTGAVLGDYDRKTRLAEEGEDTAE
jgi:quercetin dioxygenase-like cupin family protein